METLTVGAVHNYTLYKTKIKRLDNLAKMAFEVVFYSRF